MSRSSLVPVALAGALALAGCAASSNPNRPSTSRWREPEAAAAAPGPQAPAAETQGADATAQDAPDEEVAAEPQAGAPPAAADAVDGRPRLVIARVGARTIDVSRLLNEWMQTNSREVSELLERIVTGETVELEAERLGIVLDPEAVEARHREALDELKADLEKNRPGMELDDWIRTGLMIDPISFRENLRLDVRRRLFAERLVRGFVLTNERANVRVIVTDTRDELREVEAALAAGRPFEELARERSIDPSAADGGSIPPILRNGTPLSRLAFITGAGGIGGPIQDTDGKRWMLLRVDSIAPPLEGTWQEIGPTIEADLAARPIGDPEYWQWKAEMQRRYEVDLDPFFDLVDVAPPSAAGP